MDDLQKRIADSLLLVNHPMPIAMDQHVLCDSSSNYHVDQVQRTVESEKPAVAGADADADAAITKIRLNIPEFYVIP